jgi:hypothetical protein
MEEPGISHAIGDGGISVKRNNSFQITPGAFFDSSDWCTSADIGN